MKNKDLKKGRESIIGKIIYGFLLFMPLIAIGVTCITTFWNKEITTDTQTTNIKHEFTTNEVNSVNDLIIGNTYQNTFSNLNLTSPYKTIYCSQIVDMTPNRETIIYKDVSHISIQTNYIYVFSRTSGSLLVLINYLNNELTLGVTFNTDTFNVNFTTYDISNFTEYTGINPIKSVEIISTPQEEDVKNIFYYAIDKVEESNLFNWSKTTIIYTGIANTCTQIGITNTFTPMLLAYWLLISVIYILYDIILMILIILHNKIHQLQDSI